MTLRQKFPLFSVDCFDNPDMLRHIMSTLPQFDQEKEVLIWLWPGSVIYQKRHFDYYVIPGATPEGIFEIDSRYSLDSFQLIYPVLIDRDLVMGFEQELGNAVANIETELQKRVNSVYGKRALATSEQHFQALLVLMHRYPSKECSKSVLTLSS